MPDSSPLARMRAFGDRAGAWFAPVAAPLARLVFGQAFFLTGRGKFQNLDSVREFFAGLGIPFAHLQAPMIAGIEMVGGLLLIAGLFTRGAAFLLSCTMVVALLTAHPSEVGQGLLFQDSLADVAPLPFLVAMLWLLAYGPGTLSVDRLLAGRARGD
ncbi:MAG: DoxX family protein [Planctomycetota bacterium]